MIIHIKLVKGGYAGSLEEATKMDVRSVLQCMAYENFLGDYQDAYLELNRGT